MGEHRIGITIDVVYIRACIPPHQAQLTHNKTNRGLDNSETGNRHQSLDTRPCHKNAFPCPPPIALTGGKAISSPFALNTLFERHSTNLSWENIMLTWSASSLQEWSCTVFVLLLDIRLSTQAEFLGLSELRVQPHSMDFLLRHLPKKGNYIGMPGPNSASNVVWTPSSDASIQRPAPS